MSHRKSTYVVALVVLGVLIAAGGAAIARAKNSGSQAARMAQLVNFANQEINQRVAQLGALVTRIQNVKMSSNGKGGNLAAAVQGRIASLATLKTKIDADTDPVTLRADIQSITKSGPIYTLVIPQTAIAGAASNIMTTADAMRAMMKKLQIRISAAQSAGSDASSPQSATSDFNAKVSDAETQAQAAASEVSGLASNNDNQSQFADARSKIIAAQKDLNAAREDAGTIVSSLVASVAAPSTHPSPPPQ